MKKLKQFNMFATMVMVAFAVVVLTVSCDKVTPDEEKVEDTEMITVSLKGGGELEGEMTPLPVKNAAPDTVGKKPLWRVQVYTDIKTNYDSTINTSGSLKVAYGLFDDVTKAVFELKKGKAYTFEVLYMPDGRNEIRYNEYNHMWEHPFMLSYTGGQQPVVDINKVYYSTTDYFDFSGNLSGYMNLKGMTNSSYTCFNPVDVYYGVVVDATLNENSQLTVDMKRVVFGLTFKGTNMTNFPADTLLVTLAGGGTSDPITYKSAIDHSMFDCTFILPVLSMYDLMKAVLNSSYTEQVTLSIGTIANPSFVFQGYINVKRNMMHTYNFDIVSEQSNGNLKPVFNDGEMGNIVGGTLK